jgi:hypothetical protein
MSSRIPQFVLAIAVGSVLGLPCARLAQAQESWGGSGSSASLWRAGASASTGSSASGHAAPAGGSSSWTPGRGSFATAGQAGGIWHEGSSLAGAGTRIPSKTAANGSNQLNRRAALTAGLAGSSSSIRSTSSLRVSTGAHSSGSSHAAKTPNGNGSKPTMKRAGTVGHSSSSSSRGSSAQKTGTGSGFGGSPFGSSSLNSSGPSLGSSLGSGMPKSLDEMPH